MKGVYKFLSLLMIVVLILGVSPVYVHAEDGTVASVNVLHQHSGTPTVDGGCYSGVACGSPLKLITQPRICSTSLVKDSWCSAHCPSCGATYTNTVNGGYNTYSPGGCDAVVGTNSYYTCPIHGGRYGSSGVCPHEDIQMTCGLTETDIVGTLEMKKAIVGTSYTLEINSIAVSDKFSVSSYLWSNGETTETAHVLSNNNYSCTITYSDNGRVGTEVLSYDVTDFDTTPPVIETMEVSTSERTNNDVLVTLTITDDFSGAYGFSVDGGDYISGAVFTISENGTYHFKAKDNVGNETPTTTDIVINNIDKVAPTVDNVSLSW